MIESTKKSKHKKYKTRKENLSVMNEIIAFDQLNVDIYRIKTAKGLSYIELQIN